MMRRKLLVSPVGVAGDHRAPKILRPFVVIHYGNFPRALKSVEAANGYSLADTLTTVFLQNEKLADLFCIVSAEVRP